MSTLAATLASQPDEPARGTCLPRSLPAHLEEAAAWHAVVINAANMPVVVPPAAGGPLLQPQRIAFYRRKLWRPGQVLAVAFLGGSTEVQDRVLSHARAWSQHANIDFVAVKRGAVRNYDFLVSFDRPGYYSYIGTDCRMIPDGEPTTNLEGFDGSYRGPYAGQIPPESEWRRVARHEFGHGLGAAHEQFRRAIRARLDRQKVIAWGLRTQGWSAEESVAQMIPPDFDESQLDESPEADERSLMEYFFDGSLTVDGRPIVGGTDIDATDAEWAAREYPGRTTAPPAKPPTPPVTPPIPATIPLLSLGGPAATAAIPGHGKSADFALVIPDGKSSILLSVALIPTAGHEPFVTVRPAGGGATSAIRCPVHGGRATLVAPPGSYVVSVLNPWRLAAGAAWVKAD